MKLRQRLNRTYAATGLLPAGTLLLALIALPAASWAQTAVVSGTLSAFDVLNDTGQNAHGFEIQIEGALPSDLYYTAPGGRYGNATIVPYATGVYVRYQSAYSSATGQYAATTPPASGANFSWQNCYLGGAGYSTSGCEHLGQAMRPIPPSHTITVTGRWLVDDPNNHGQLIALDPPAAIPSVTWSVAPAAIVGTAPVVTAKAVVPTPPKPQFSDAQWVKIYKTQLPRAVDSGELVSGNAAVVPEDPAQIEVSWDILQTAPPNSNTRKNRSSRSNQAPITITTHSVIRRYELYKYTGKYDPLTHEVLCADGTCTAPSTGELGGPLSANNTASNVVADSLTVTRTGSGAGSATVGGGPIGCGGACSAFGPNGSSLTLTASPGSTIFTGWSGACTGTQSTCSAAFNGQTTVNANFLLQFTLSVGRSNPGTVTATPAGNDRVLDCGGNCSAKFTDGTAVTLTAVPPDGKQFVNWAGACSGSSPVCTLTINKDTSVQAVFSK